MDYTKVKCISYQCVDNDVIMNGAGANFGGRVSISKLRCPECGIVIMIIPMNENYQYEIRATTKEERIEERIKEAKEKADLELAKTITRIKETGY